MMLKEASALLSKPQLRLGRERSKASVKTNGRGKTVGQGFRRAPPGANGVHDVSARKVTTKSDVYKSAGEGNAR